VGRYGGPLRPPLTELRAAERAELKALIQAQTVLSG
jgi:hypothetical protein